jgi:hypothetical protein
MPMSLGHGRGPLKPFGFGLPSTALPPYQPVGLLVNEDCEGIGTPSGWTDLVGTPNWDYTTTPLDGSQSLYLPTNERRRAPALISAPSRNFGSTC